VTGPAACATSAPPARHVSPLPGSPTGWLAVAFGAIGGVVAVGQAMSYHLPACTLLELTGVPCPACGLTRLGVHLARGDVAVAVAGDLPGVLLVVLVALTAAAQLRAVAGRPVPWLRSAALPLILGGLVLAHWVVTLTTGGLLD